MAAHTDTRAPGDATPADLAARIGQAVGNETNGNGNGAITAPGAREVALDVCRAILADAGTGTAEHSDDVVLIAEGIGERMGFAGTERENLLIAAQLHDIGKARIPSSILDKPGPLTKEEWSLMRQHTVVGEQILNSVDELAEVGRLVRYSHERWDGQGYPDGLKGDRIPLGSRIIFCADAFHAIRCDRPYRRGRSADEALAEIRRCSGTQFDPAVADAIEQVVLERRARPRGGRSSRLFALLMCLAIGGAGTAIARSSLLGDAGNPTPSPIAPALCGTAGCATPAVPLDGAGSPAPPNSSASRIHHLRLHAGIKHRSASGGSFTQKGAGGDQTRSGQAPGSAGKESVQPSHSGRSGKSGSAPGHTKPSGTSGPGSSRSAPGHTKPASSGGYTSNGHGSGGSNGN